MVICLTTNKIFETIKSAGKEYGIKSTSRICQVCKGVYDYAGKLADGTKLKWMYYEDFLKLPQEEQNEIIDKIKDSAKQRVL